MSASAEEPLKVEPSTIEEKIAAVDINSTTNETTDLRTQVDSADEKQPDEQKKTTSLTRDTEFSPVAASLREKPAGAIKTPFVDPLPTCKPTPPVELTTDQQTKYNTLLELVKAWKEIPAKNDKAGPITDNEIMWLTKECILRYLRATKWKVNDAGKRLLDTLIWRREYGVEALTADYISPENETGKQVSKTYT